LSAVAVYTILGKDGDAQKDFDRAVELGFDPVLLVQLIEELKGQR